MFLVETDVL